jgi:hypothetical protein
MQDDTRFDERTETREAPERADNPFNEMIHRFEGQYGRDKASMVRAFGEAGWKKCGQGKNGRVAASPCGDYVVRISGEDAGFERHADLSREHADNKHFPRVFAHKTLQDGSLVTIMEKLAPLPKNLTSQRAQVMHHIAFGDAKSISPELKAAADVVRAQTDLPKDVHGGDIMYRPSDRSLVIVDPYR